MGNTIEYYKKYNKLWVARNREYNKERARKWRRENPEKYERDMSYCKLRYRMRREWVNEYKRQHPCIDCGATNPIVLDFDHRDPKAKSFSIGQSVSKMSLSKIQAEIEKCDVRCSNCHRIKTHNDRVSRGLRDHQ